VLIDHDFLFFLLGYLHTKFEASIMGQSLLLFQRICVIIMCGMSLSFAVFPHSSKRWFCSSSR